MRVDSVSFRALVLLWFHGQRLAAASIGHSHRFLTPRCRPMTSSSLAVHAKTPLDPIASSRVLTDTEISSTACGGGGGSSIPGGSVTILSNDDPFREQDEESSPSFDPIVSAGGDSTAVSDSKAVSEEPSTDTSPTATKSDKASGDVAPARRRLFKRKKPVDPNSTAFSYAKKLKNRNHLNFKRKITHTAFGFLFATLNHMLPREKFLPGMTLLTSATLVMELLRYKKGFGWMNDALHFFLGSALRKQEMEGKFTGSFYYFFGVTSTSFLFGKNAATIGICQLALADPAASYFGRQTRHVYWSRIERGFFGLGRNKGLLGFLGGALFCLPFNYYMLSIAKWGVDGIPGGKQALFTASLGLGAAGALADLFVPTPAITMPRKVCGIPVPPFHVDDNFVVPICSGYACTKIFQALNWPQNLSLAKCLFF